MAACSPENTITRIRPRTGFEFLDLRQYWRFRELQLFLVWRDVKVRYKQTVLGVAWALLQPLFTMVVFSVLFGRLVGLGQRTEGVPYPLFVIWSLVLWNFFAQSVTAAGNSMLANQGLITKVFFPRIMIPWGVVGASLVDMFIALGMAAAMFVWYGMQPTLGLLLLPIPIALLLLVTAGVGTILSALTASYRDFRYLVTFFVQIWLFCTPVFYPLSLFPERWRWVVCLNPLTGIIELSRYLLFGTGSDQLYLCVAVSAVSALACFILSIFAFQRLDRRLVDFI